MIYLTNKLVQFNSFFMRENGIPRRGSDDVLAVWNGKIAKTN